mmetsp:Transcript_1977/g.2807  ORF Transcript_1977/g.2807 Transcript_1977/m.2807 type:complete len:337 (-) Transcript_1977:164-1174(-)
MEEYRRVETPKPEIEIKADEIRITAQGKQSRHYVNYALKKLGHNKKSKVDEEATKEEEPEEAPLRAIRFRAMGQAINTTVTAAEVVKRLVPGLHQITKISSSEITDVYEPEVEGLKTVTVKRRVSSIEIILSKDPLDVSDIGYQAPLPEVKETTERKGNQGGRRGNRRGRGGRRPRRRGGRRDQGQEQNGVNENSKEADKAEGDKEAEEQGEEAKAEEEQPRRGRGRRRRGRGRGRRRGRGGRRNQDSGESKEADETKAENKPSGEGTESNNSQARGRGRGRRGRRGRRRGRRGRRGRGAPRFSENGGGRTAAVIPPRFSANEGGRSAAVEAPQDS